MTKKEINRMAVEKYRKNSPWLRVLHDAKNRCNSKKNPRYYRYGGRGVRVLLTKEDIKYLWFKDKAFLLNRPSIDRIDNDGNYSLENCRFVELSYNSGRKFPTKNCKNNHDPKFFFKQKSGGRVCWVCKRNREKMYYLKRKKQIVRT